MKPMFTALNSNRIAALILGARHRICFVAPGVQRVVETAICEVFQRLEPGSVTVSIDLDERVMRMGYGDIEAVQKLQQAGLSIHNSSGLRTAVLIVDEEGFVFTPTALYLEQEPQSEETPNAIRLSTPQIHELLIRLSPHARAEAIEQAQTDDERREIEAVTLETGVEEVSSETLSRVAQKLKNIPPVEFDIVRQVRVFEAYLQHVKLSLTGVAIQRNRVRIPKVLQNIGTSKDLEGKLKTTFDLIEKGSELSSKGLEDDLNQIRKDFTPSLGKDHGRVVLKVAKPHLVKRIKELRSKVEAHQKKIEAELQTKLDDSLKQVAEYYFPLVKSNPPDSLIGSFPSMNEENIRAWIHAELAAVFPQAATLIKKMTLSEHYMDFTYETLNQSGFIDLVKSAYPHVDWEKTYSEFKAAGEKE